MAFLRSVSEYSVLARRYVVLLEKYQRDPEETEHTTSSDTVVSSPIESLTPFHQQIESNLPLVVMEQSGMPSGLDDDMDFTNMHFPYPNDFLFGTGLPQEFLNTDWSLFDSGLN